MTKFNVDGKGQVDLTKKDFIAKGGEGAVYARGNIAYKIYCDDKDKPNPAKMIDVNKIKELSTLTDSNIIRPQDVIYSGRVAIGYTMRYVKDTYQLCQLFTNAFKKRNHLKPEDMVNIVEKLREIVTHTHQHKCLIVDMNEMNFLASQDFSEIFAIDVDSWQTPSFPATAIMESIRDRHVKKNKFTEGSDWFSFGILAHQLMRGIHPYKGKHTKIKDLDERMLKNISVFNKDVSIPKICLPTDVIPKAYQSWMKAIFEDGKRIPPPTNPNELIVIFKPTVTKIAGSNNFDITILDELDSDIISAYYSGNKKVFVFQDAVYVGKRKMSDFKSSNQVIGFTDNNIPILAWIQNGTFHCFNLNSKQEMNVTANAQSIMESDGRLYVKNLSVVSEIIFKDIGTNVFVTLKRVSNVIDKASTLYEGCVIQNLLGSCYVSLFPESGMSYQINIKELDKHRIIDAKFSKNVLMVVSENKGKYYRLIVRFDSDYKEYDMRGVKDIQYSGLNFTVLDKGICACITEDETLELFSNKKDQNEVKSIDDSIISGNMKLLSNGNTVMFFNDNKVCQIKMK